MSQSSKYDSGQEIRTGPPEYSDVRSVELLKLPARERGTGTGHDGRGGGYPMPTTSVP